MEYSIRKIKTLTLVTLFTLQVGIYLLLPFSARATTPATTLSGEQEYVYYGYVPPSTDIAALHTIPPAAPVWEQRPAPGNVDEMTDGKRTNRTVPSGYSLLDIVGLEDNTRVEIWDIYAKQKINSTLINKLERRIFYIHHGTYFKIAASSRVAAMLTGGQNLHSQYYVSGTSMFYPSVEGGFRGREFIFTAAPATHPYMYSMEQVGYNFFLVALEDSDWRLEDRVGKWSTGERTKQRDIVKIMLQSRINRLEYHSGVGNDIVFHLTSTGDVMASCAALNDFVAVPAITGGFVGKLFYAPEYLTKEEPGNRTAAFIVIPLEPGKVTVYNIALEVVAERTFTSEDVANMAYWYKDLGPIKSVLIAKSEGNMTFTVGQTYGGTTEYFLGDDITFTSAKPDEEIRFYAPTIAVVFAPQDITISIDGKPSTISRDDFTILDSGPHSVKADGCVIVQTLARGSGWYDWGTYLITPSDVLRTYQVPEGFLGKTQEYTTYIAIAVSAAVIATAAAIILKRRRKIRYSNKVP